MSKATDWTDREFVASLITDGMTLAVDGFGLYGMSHTLIGDVHDSEAKDLITVSNNMGINDTRLGILPENKQMAKAMAPYVGENRELVRRYLESEIEVGFTPQGTLAERLHTGGAGIPAFYTATDVGTFVAEDRLHVDPDGQTYVQERGIVANVDLVRAYHGDIDGNLTYRRIAQNFNPLRVTFGKVTVVEMKHLLDRGEIGPDRVMTPDVYVQHIVRGDGRKKFIEKRTARPRNIASSHNVGDTTAGEKI